MNATEYLRHKQRMCKSVEMNCRECDLEGGYHAGCGYLERDDPETAVEIVRQWAVLNPVEDEVTLTTIERQFVRIYIERGYLWAARDKNGELHLYTREPARSGAGKFINVSPSKYSRRKSLAKFPAITWENSPVCLPRLLES